MNAATFLFLILVLVIFFVIFMEGRKFSEMLRRASRRNQPKRYKEYTSADRVDDNDRK